MYQHALHTEPNQCGNGSNLAWLSSRSSGLIGQYPSRSTGLLEKIINEKKSDARNGTAKSTSAPLLLRIVVVGAGLGGLATAIALARRGHAVTVLEQAQQLGEVGAGIQIPPNSSKLLRSWGIDPFFEGRTTEPESMTFRRWKTGETIGYTNLKPNFHKVFGAPYYVIHRADFHSSLCKLADSLGVKILTRSRVEKYGESDCSVETTDGRKFDADLIVAADGINSVARGVVLQGHDVPNTRTGFAAYRATVDTAQIRDDPEISWLLEKPNINVWIGEDRHVMTYCIAGGAQFNLVLSHIDHTDPSTWNQDTAMEDMRAYFEGWDSTITKIIGMITKAVKWPLQSGSRLPTWIAPNKSLVIIGDAAHSMVPYMSQGAAMAVEDGAALAESLSIPKNKEEIPSVLKIFEEERMARSYGMQSASLVNGKLWHFADGPEQEARDLGMRSEVEGKHFLESTNQWSDPVTQHWTYGYDAEKAIQNAWATRKSL